MNKRENNARLPRQTVLGVAVPTYTKATQFQAVSFYDQQQQRQIVLLYALGADGIVREYNGGANTWKPYPIESEVK